MKLKSRLYIPLLLLSLLASTASAQTARTARAEQGSLIAKNGFRNESEIQQKFNDWKNDMDARGWLTAMGYEAGTIEGVRAVKPHGEKSDVQLTVTTATGVFSEGISIKLVSSESGFNQIDKRWLSHYAAMWAMPDGVKAGLELFLGETPPVRQGRAPNRMYLNELDGALQDEIVRFFSVNKKRIVSDLLRGSGEFDADWIMVAVKDREKPRWVLRRMEEAIKFFATGEVVITRRGNLKIGRITMQRKGGDAGRKTANMLQFKIDPTLLFNAP